MRGDIDHLLLCRVSHDDADTRLRDAEVTCEELDDRGVRFPFGGGLLHRYEEVDGIEFFDALLLCPCFGSDEELHVLWEREEYTSVVNPYRELFKAMNDAGIRYLVVGGVAVNLHGYSRFTGDLDVLVALDALNLDRLGHLMEERGFVQRLPIDVRLLSDKKQVQQWITDKGLTAYTFIDAKLPQFSLDVLAGASLDFDTFEQHKAVITAEDLPIPVISIDDLIGMKRRANRQKDIEDIAALLELKGL